MKTWNKIREHLAEDKIRIYRTETETNHHSIRLEPKIWLINWKMAIQWKLTRTTMSATTKFKFETSVVRKSNRNLPTNTYSNQALKILFEQTRNRPEVRQIETKSPLELSHGTQKVESRFWKMEVTPPFSWQPRQERLNPKIRELLDGKIRK